MRLLHVNLRSLLIYSLLLVLISIPISIFSIREILEEELDESLALHSEQFVKHIKHYEYLDDLDLDLKIWDQLSYDIMLEPSTNRKTVSYYKTITVYDSIEQEFHEFRTLSSNITVRNKAYLLTIRMSMVDNDELVLAIGIVQAALILLLSVGLLILNQWLSKRLWQPFYNTLDQLKAYQIDKTEVLRTEKTRIIEFNDLNNAVSHLMERSKKVFTEQKEFIENASHELQTPLAIFQSKLDNLMQNPRLTESDASTILELEETAQRMARLNKNLLLLSKIDNNHFSDKTSVNVADVARQLLNHLRTMAGIERITFDISLDPLLVEANETLIEVMLSNLFHNAVRHAPPDGSIIVKTISRSLIVKNTGMPLRMDPSKIFERFSKESNSEQSSGLGLAIVKRICDTSQYVLAYKYESGFHIFSITF